MLWFWFYVALLIWPIGLTAYGLPRWYRIYRANRGRRWSDKDGMIHLWGWGSGVAALAAVVMIISLVATVIDRHVSRQSCAKRDDVSAAEYVWVDYHFFSYDCTLITPSGNITETPILPLEDVGAER